MSPRDPRFWLGFFSAGAVLFVAFRDLGSASPGDLAEVHSREDDLDSRSACSQCHGSLTVSMTDACLECHEPVGDHLEAEEGFHGSLSPVTAKQCWLCHSEHHGEEFALINAKSFLIAGVPDADEFPHDEVGFEMSGSHLELSCNECHENADVEVLERGEQRFMGLDQDCATCHDDPHDGQLSQNCTDCHGQTAFDQLDHFEHDEKFPLTGSHAAPSCLECHPRDGKYAVELLVHEEEIANWRECSECHESPHESMFVKRVAEFVGMTEGGSCESCHEIEHLDFRDERVEVTPRTHAFSGFMLREPHADVSCDECHQPESEDFDDRYPDRRSDDCAARHVDPHQGQFETGLFAAAGCLGCHEGHRFEPHRFTLQKHEKTSLPLAGKHAETECNVCHVVPTDGAARVFHDTPTTCEACHEDAHENYFDRFGADLEPLDQGECARCHGASSFSELPAEGFDHEYWTGFLLKGAHAANACETCHERSAHQNEFFRTFGWAHEQFDSVDGCAGCHADPHDGEFEDKLPARIDGKVGCARCHTETSFRHFEDGIDHALWTGFPLDGAHKYVSCSECHAPIANAGNDERTFERAKGTDCFDCHGFPHVRQFDIEGVTDCTRCHETTESFSILSFDHDVDSRFPLEDSHKALACNECHKPWALEGKAEVIRYRPLGMECTDRHGGAEGERKKRQKQKELEKP